MTLTEIEKECARKEKETSFTIIRQRGKITQINSRIVSKSSRLEKLTDIEKIKKCSLKLIDMQRKARFIKKKIYRETKALIKVRILKMKKLSAKRVVTESEVQKKKLSKGIKKITQNVD